MNESTPVRIEASPADDSYSGRRLSWPLRLASILAGTFLLVLLVIAARLNPNPTGHGTHQQLGLPPCTSIELFNMPCPACGMTTAWANLLRGHVLRSAENNLGGLLLAIIAIAYVPASCYFFVSGRSTKYQWFSLTLAIAMIVALSLAVLQWIARLLS